jgi:hypothetical protein
MEGIEFKCKELGGGDRWGLFELVFFFGHCFIGLFNAAQTEKVSK